MVQILFYTTNPSQFATEITCVLALSASCSCQLKCFYNYQELHEFIRTEPKNELIAILTALSDEELDQLVSDKQIFETITMVLILADEDDNTLRKGHALRPRFISTVNQKFNYTLSVVKHLVNKHNENR